VGFIFNEIVINTSLPMQLKNASPVRAGSRVIELR